MNNNNLYRNIVIGLANAFSNDVFKAQVVRSASFRNQVFAQINNLLSLEKNNDASLNNQKYALIFAQIVANLSNEKATISRRASISPSIIDESFIDFIDFVVSDTNLKAADLKNESIGLDPINIKLNAKMSPVEAKTVLDIFEQQPTVKTVEAKPVFDDQKTTNQGQKQTASATNQSFRSNNQQNQQQAFRGFAGGMFGTGGNIPGGNFPLHPRFDRRFYPYTTKPKFMPTWQLVLRIMILATALTVVLITLIGQFKSVTISGSFYFFSSGKLKGMLFPSSTPPSSAVKTLTQKSALSVLLAPQSFGLWSGLILLLPAGYMIYKLISGNRYPWEKYVFSNYTLGLNLVLFLITLISFIMFIMPNSLQKGIGGLTAVGGVSPAPSAQSQTDFINGIINKIRATSFYKTMQVLVIIGLIFLSITMIALFTTFFLNPRLDRNKIIKANTEYQKAVNAQMGGQHYEMDPSIYDEEFAAPLPSAEQSNSS